MQNVTPQDGQSADIVSENIKKLKELFPDAFTEDGVNFDVLRQLLGDAEVLDEGDEKYGLNWHGKKAARQIALTPSAGTLLPCPEESISWETTKNVFIEGDNLEVMKLLQKSYAGKVKLIYIDPPYNTDKDFVYPDRYSEGLETYLRYTGQKTASGEWTVSKSGQEKTGRKHTQWLNMMMPRLVLARNLLTADGVILISIDEKESSNLRSVCDQVFGEENFVAQFSVVTNYKGRNDKTNVAMAHEYVMAYKKSGFVSQGLPLTEAQIAEFKLVLEDGRKYKLRDLRKRGGPDTREDRPKMWFPLFYNKATKTMSLERQSPEDIEITPLKSDGSDGRWRWGKDKVRENLSDLEASYVKKSDKWNISYRIFLDNAGPTPIEGEEDLDEDEFDETEFQGSLPKSIWMGGEFSTDAGKRALKKLIPGTSLEYPKSVELLKRCVYYGTSKDDLILDFFFGSGTLAQAVFEVEQEDPRGRHFIGVQLPEPIDEKSAARKAGFLTVADIAKERMRKAAEHVRSLGEEKIDLGFKVLKLSGSNIRQWNPDRTDLEETLLSHKEHLVEGRTEQDVLYELLLKRGIELTVPIEERQAAGKTIYSIGYGVLFACLDTSIAASDVDDVAQGILDWHKELAPETDTHVFFRDSAFADDIAKTNMAAILEQNGISHVRSL